jgi:hypothetical protein
MILVDTSIYISALTDQDLEHILQKAHEKAFIISSEIVEKEIEDAADYLRKIGKKNDAQRLKDIYYAVVSGTIRLTKRVIYLSDKYAAEVKKRISKDRSREMSDDFRIVSSAAIGSIEAIVTFNRRTMANPEIIAIYKEVNDKTKLKTPKFIRTKEELLKFLSS